MSLRTTRLPRPEFVTMSLENTKKHPAELFFLVQGDIYWFDINVSGALCDSEKLTWRLFVIISN